MQRYLYRGVNPDLHRHNNGKLVPKAIGLPFKDYVYLGGDSYWNDGSVWGESETNPVIQHQRDSSKNPTSGVSTTPVFEKAKFYATHDGRYDSGYVYKIDRDKLPVYGISEYVVKEHATLPHIPEDQEVILVAEDFGALPSGIIAEVLEV